MDYTCSFISQPLVDTTSTGTMFAGLTHSQHSPRSSPIRYETPFPQPSYTGSHPAQPISHPQQSRIQQLNMQQAAYQQLATQHASQEQQTVAPTPRVKAQTKAERRAEHNATERARREGLNSKFQQLAHALPNLQNDRRPSKGTIIERTLEYVRLSLSEEQRYKHQMRILRRENRKLRKQLLGREVASPVPSTSDDEPSYYSYQGHSNILTPTLPNGAMSTSPQPQAKSSAHLNASHVTLAQQQLLPDHWDVMPSLDDKSCFHDNSTNSDLNSSHFTLVSDHSSPMVMVHSEYSAALAKGFMAYPDVHIFMPQPIHQ